MIATLSQLQKASQIAAQIVDQTGDDRMRLTTGTYPAGTVNIASIENPALYAAIEPGGTLVRNASSVGPQPLGGNA